MKNCTSCNQSKPISLFFKRKASHDGLKPICKQCDQKKRKERINQNPEKERAYQSAYKEKHVEKYKAYFRTRYASNSEEHNKKGMQRYRENKAEHLARSKDWRKKNVDYLKTKRTEKRISNGEVVRAKRRADYVNRKAAYVAAARKREADKIKATPAWADLKAIEAIYVERERVSQETKIIHHVDHIIPLKGKTVCGLHVEYNLRIIPAAMNLKKSNFIEKEAHAHQTY